MKRLNLSSARRSCGVGRIVACALIVLAALDALPSAATPTYSYASDTYSWETAANATSWIASSCTDGTQGDDDEVLVTFTGGFTFPFAGTAYGAMRMTSNGMIQFGADTGIYRNSTTTAMPVGQGDLSANAGCPTTQYDSTNVLLPYWKDLNPTRAGNVGTLNWEQKGTAPNRYVVALWNSIYQPTNGKHYTFEVILSENGSIKYQYNTANTGTEDGTIGIQVSPTDYTQYSYASGATMAGWAIRWTPATPVASLDHVEVHDASASGLTCTPTTFTLVACADAACATAYTGGVTGTLVATGSGMTEAWPDGTAFSIASGASTVNMRMQLTSVGSVVVGLSGVSPAPANATTCNFASPGCTFSAADSGLLFSVPNHAAESSQAVTVSAVKKADSSLACTPAFASVTRSVIFKCAYANPATGTLPARIGGAALNAAGSATSACDAGGHSLSLAFNASGVASTSLLYADAGQMTVTGTYTGSAGTNDAGLTMSGSSSFVAAPASFAIGGLPSPVAQAGIAYSASVTALNSLGNATANFGNESTPQAPAMATANRLPSGGAVGTFGPASLSSFAGGVATWSNVAWTEVGSMDLTATLANYLAGGVAASGTSNLRWVPHHFKVALTGLPAACVASGFSYAGQAFTTTVTAQNAANATTTNYASAFANAVSLTPLVTPPAGESISGNSVAANAFTSGIGTATPTYSFATKQTAPRTLELRALDADSVTSSAATENTIEVRSGQMKLSYAFGSEKTSLSVPVRAQYWSGNSWLVNSADNCTAVPAAAVALSNVRDNKGAAASWTTSAAAATLTNGIGAVVLAPPSATGTVDIALNLGAGGTDQSCLANHPSSTGAGLAWLRSHNGSCASTWDRDPSARASFGIYSPESSKTVHARNID